MRNAFTLVELVFVILILGILAGVAAPKFFSTSDLAGDNAVRQSLAVVRDAIEVYLAQNGRLPGADGSKVTLKSDLATYLRQFPMAPGGGAMAPNDEVAMDGSAGPIAGVAAPTEAWRYYYKLGTFIVNSNQRTKSDSTIKYDDL